MKEKLVKIGLTEELAQKVVDNLGTVIDGEYVTKVRFNEINTELKTANDTIKERDTQLETLKNSTGDTEALKAEITTLQAANKTAKEEGEKALAAEKKNNAIKLELIGKVYDSDMAISLLNMDKIIMDDNGKVTAGLKEQLGDLKKSKEFMFIPESKGTQQNNVPFVKGATPKEGEGAQQTDLSAAEMMAKQLAQNTNNTIKKTAESTYFGE